MKYFGMFFEAETVTLDHQIWRSARTGEIYHRGIIIDGEYEFTRVRCR